MEGHWNNSLKELIVDEQICYDNNTIYNPTVPLTTLSNLKEASTSFATLLAFIWAVTHSDRIITSYQAL